MTGSPVFSVNFTNQKFQLTYYYPIMSRPWISWLWDFYIMISLGVSVLMFMTIFMIFSLVGNFTNFSLLMQRFMINFPQNWLVWSGSWHMIVSSSWIFSICEVYWNRTAGHLVLWKPWPAVDLKKVLSVTKHGFIFWAQCKPNTKLEIYEAFQDRLTFLK